MDISGRVTNVNESLRRFYPELKNRKKGFMLNDFLTGHAELGGLSLKNPETEFQRCEEGKKRYCSARLTPVSSETGTQIGTILAIKDVTVYVEHQNQLKELAEDARRQAETQMSFYFYGRRSARILSTTRSASSLR